MSESLFTITIDGQTATVSPGQSVLFAARSIGIDIPTLCYLEKCGPLNSCLVCLVKINGKLVPSCGTKVTPGMSVESETVEVHEARKTALELLFSDHVGDCLSPCHRLCPLRLNIPVMLRQVQAGKLDEAIVLIRDTLPLAGVLGRLCHHPCEQGCRRGTWDEPAAIRNLERMVTDAETKKPEGYLPTRKALTGKSVAIIGAGPAGLTAAYDLLRKGHACAIVDRNHMAGGSLRGEVLTESLPPAVLDSEINQLERLGVTFKLGVTFGTDVTLEGLLRGFDAVLVAIGETSRAEGEALGLEMTNSGVKAHPDTYQTRNASVFAAGRALKPMNQLVRTMSEGRAAAECVHQFLSGRKVQRPDKPFSVVMGRLDDQELNLFLQDTEGSGRISPCDACAGFNKREGALEASRCLHCDCRSSGQCGLQFYAQTYQADANKYRQQRRRFEQLTQPGGIIFEPGKCILCGICVKLTELAREPLGLTFIGRGFDVRVSAPLNHTIEEGLQKVAAECVEHCPTGALTLRETSSY